MTLFVGDDWAEDHHDIHIQDQQGHKLAAARIPEGVSGIARLHELIATHLPEHTGPEQVRVCIETDQGPWVGALVAAGYQVLGVNPKQAARHREGMVVSGAKSDKTDAYAWPIWPAPVTTNSGRSPVTPPTPQRSRSWRGRIKP
jgi:transposase